MTDMKSIPFWVSLRLNSLLNTEVKFSTEIKSDSGLCIFRLSCERTLNMISGKNYIFLNSYILFSC